MVVGNGMLAQAFASFAARRDVVVFASGVSNSLETRAAAFTRERKLLKETRTAHPDALLLYFSTCSTDDPDRRDTPYVSHKLAMEALVREGPGPWLVLRLPLAIGPGHRGATLAKFLYERISRGERFQVWKHSTRYPVDVADVVRIVERLVADPALHRRTINVALRPYPVLEFVRILEKIAGRPALYDVVEKGAHYDVPCPEVDAIRAQLALEPGEDYLERVLRKYFAR